MLHPSFEVYECFSGYSVSRFDEAHQAKHFRLNLLLEVLVFEKGGKL